MGNYPDVFELIELDKVRVKETRDLIILQEKKYIRETYGSGSENYAMNSVLQDEKEQLTTLRNMVTKRDIISNSLNTVHKLRQAIQDYDEK
jgi:hypothetical protein